MSGRGSSPAEPITVPTVPEVSVVYVTHRPAPQFDWFIDGLANQLADDDLEVILVDGLYSADRAAEVDRLVRGRFPFRHVPPKPTPWNGPHRLTRRDYFAAASARNTGIVHATGEYIVFVDDCSVLMPGWWGEARAAARHGYVVAGAYDYHLQMVVADGVLRTSRPKEAGRDIRWERGDDTGLVQIGGGELFGCSFGAPRRLLVEVNGLDELCDPIGGEDYQLGLRLEWAGARIFYSRRMLTVESDDRSHGSSPARLGRVAEPDAYMERLRTFGVMDRSTDGEWSNSWMVLDIAYGTRSIRSLGNYYDLGVLTDSRPGGDDRSLSPRVLVRRHPARRPLSPRHTRNCPRGAGRRAGMRWGR